MDEWVGKCVLGCVFVFVFVLFVCLFLFKKGGWVWVQDGYFFLFQTNIHTHTLPYLTLSYFTLFLACNLFFFARDTNSSLRQTEVPFFFLSFFSSFWDERLVG